MTYSLLAAIVVSAFGAQSKKIDWKKNYDGALKEAQKDGKYVVLHFTGSN